MDQGTARDRAKAMSEKWGGAFVATTRAALAGEFEEDHPQPNDWIVVRDGRESSECAVESCGVVIERRQPSGRWVDYFGRARAFAASGSEYEHDHAPKD